ncbi:MAG: Rad4-like protein [Amphiamblys sp. WSBS2006]|nr:MAG: Rad4-like protein [Amphiamblys sp. WSBS2006]
MQRAGAKRHGVFRGCVFTTSVLAKKERDTMQSIALHNGGVYSADMTPQTTHLATRTCSGEKYKHALEWGIEVITPEWVYDSVQHGRVLAEGDYTPDSLPGEKTEKSTDGCPEDLFDGDVFYFLNEKEGKETRKRILLAGGMRTQTPDDASFCVVSLRALSEREIDALLGLPPGQPVVLGEWIDRCYRHGERVGDEKYKIKRERLGELKSLLGKENTFSLETGSPKKQKIFSNCVFEVFCEEKTRLYSIIAEHGGVFGGKTTHSVFPVLLREERNWSGVCVSVAWVEDCVARRRYIDPDRSVLYRPVSCFGKGFSGASFHLSGLGIIAARHTKMLIEGLGGVLRPQLCRQCNFLIYEKENQSKKRYALQKGIKTSTLGEFFTNARKYFAARRETDTPPRRRFGQLTMFQARKKTVQGVLNGVVVCLSKRLLHRRGPIQKAVEDLGGVFFSWLDKSCTHYIHQTRENCLDSTQHTQGISVVSPEWVFACQKEQRRVGESEYGPLVRQSQPDGDWSGEPPSL